MAGAERDDQLQADIFLSTRTDLDEDGTRRLRGTDAKTDPGPAWRKPFLTIHIVTSVGVLGADLMFLALGISGAQGSNPQTVYPAFVIAPLVAITLLVLNAGLGIYKPTWRLWSPSG